MTGRVVRLVTRRERFEAAQMRAVRDAVQGIPDDLLAPFARVGVLKAIDALTRPAIGETDWPGGYSMIGLTQIGRVWDAIRALPARDRPQDVRHCFDLVLQHLEPGEGRVNLTRDEFAAKMDVDPKHVSSALGVLVRMGVLFREVVRVPGMRGPGMAVFLINPNVAWNGPLDVRKQEAAKRPGPLLKLMETPPPGG